MPITLHRQRPAMGTWFEVWLVGDDAEHLAAVADAALDEVERVERLLSRFDPRSEVTRLNREAASRAVRVDYELLEIVRACRAGWERTGGYFDPTVGSRSRIAFDGIQIDEDRRTIRFLDGGLALDLGGFGKGYALDRAVGVLAAFGVYSALLHGGTSSVRALGRDAEGHAWLVELRHATRQSTCRGDTALRAPSRSVGGEANHSVLTQGTSGFSIGRTSPGRRGASNASSHTQEKLSVRQPRGTGQAAYRLSDRALSCSSALAPGRDISDTLDPFTGDPLRTSDACIVLDRSAAEAEILSTALLAMGKARAALYAERHARNELAIAWLEPGRAPEWLTGTP